MKVGPRSDMTLIDILVSEKNDMEKCEKNYVLRAKLVLSILDG